MSTEDGYIIENCKCCGNRGLLKKVAEYTQEYCDYDDGQPTGFITKDWVLLECPVCQTVSLYQRYTASWMIDYQGEQIYQESIVYPENKKYPNVPKDIMKSYIAAVNTVKVDLNVSLVAIRAVLEKICKERGSTRKNLESMLKQMVEKHILPETLDKCSFIIRKLGNAGAHGDDDSLLTKRDVEELIGFIETIMYYIYELPVKIEKLNCKYDLEG